MELAHKRESIKSIPPFLSEYGTDFGQFQVRHSRLRSGTLLLPRADQFKIVMPIVGSWSLRTGKNTINFSRGDVAMVPGLAHGEAVFRDIVDNLIIRIDSNLVSEIANELHLDVDLATLRPKKCESRTVQALSRRLAAELQRAQENDYSSRFANGLVIALLGFVLGEFAVTARTTTSSVRRLSSRQLAACAEFVDSHLEGDVSLPAIAAHVGLSHFYFSRAFKNATGMSLRQFVIRRRIERAKELLTSSLRSVLDVGHDVGFRNHSHFSSVFRQQTGETPTEYRRHGCAGLPRTQLR